MPQLEFSVQQGLCSLSNTFKEKEGNTMHTGISDIFKNTLSKVSM